MAIDIRTKQFGKLFSDNGDDAPPPSARDRKARRERLFRETAPRRALRVAGALASGLGRLGPAGVTGALDCIIREKAIRPQGLPDPESARGEDGLCGLVSEATPEALLEGFARGLYTAAPLGVLTWWAPRTRMVAAPGEFVAPANVAERLARGDFHFALDRDFDVVVKRCGRRARMTPKLMHLYSELFDMGFAHSFELRSAFGRILACGFGVAIGKVFVTVGVDGDAADDEGAALALFDGQLARMEFALHDAIGRADLARFGFSAIERGRYFRALVENSGMGRLGRWQAREDFSAAKDTSERGSQKAA